MDEIQVSLEGGGSVVVTGEYELRTVTRVAIVINGVEQLTAFEDLERLRAAIEGKRALAEQRAAEREAAEREAAVPDEVP